MPDILYFAEVPGATYEARYLLPFLDLTGGSFVTDDKDVIKKLKAKYSKISSVHIKFGTKKILHTTDAKVSVYSNFYPKSNSKYNVLFMHGVADKRGIARAFTFKDQNALLYRATSVLSKDSKINPLSNRAVPPFKWLRSMIRNRFQLILIPGQALLDLFKGIGAIKKGNHEIIGFPRFDPIFNGEIDRNEILKELALDPDKKTILYAPTWHGKLDINMNSMETMGEAIIASVRGEYNLIVRPHPRTLINNEAPKVLKLLHEKTKTSDNIRLVSDPFTDTIELMVAADIMIADYSSVGIEFLALDKPIIYADHLGESYSDPAMAEIYTREAGYVVNDGRKFR